MRTIQGWRWAAGMFALSVFASAFSSAMGGEKFNRGLNVGDKIPKLSLVDQDGKKHNYKSLRGQQGTLIIFHRSADW